MSPKSEALRVAFIAGTLGRGGAERQMSYMARALQEAGSQVRVCSLTQGEYYETEFQHAGIETMWVGRYANPAARVSAIITQLRRFRPHVLQSMHSFANLYAALPARALDAISVGALRCDLELAVRDNGKWTKWLLRIPDGLLVNSQIVCQQLVSARMVSADRLFYLTNVVDLDYYGVSRAPHQGPVVIFVGRLVAEKRLDCFLRAVAIARARCRELRAIVVGDGPERASAEVLASELQLLPGHVRFLGARDDVRVCLAESDMLLMCSETEGSANVLLEAMAARLPVVTTPAGDAQATVRHEHTGFVVPFGDVQAMAERLVCLSNSQELRTRLGNSGQAVAHARFSPTGLSDRLCKIYGTISRQKRNRRLSRLEPAERYKAALANSGSAHLT